MSNKKGSNAAQNKKSFESILLNKKMRKSRSETSTSNPNSVSTSTEVKNIHDKCLEEILPLLEMLPYEFLYDDSYSLASSFLLNAMFRQKFNV